jgi:hypothetical protein
MFPAEPASELRCKSAFILASAYHISIVSFICPIHGDTSTNPDECL